MKNEKLNFSEPQKGFIVLITVLIILGIVLLIGLTMSQLSIGETQMSLQKFQSSKSMYIANLCTEDALMKLKETNGSYTGETLNIEGGNCIISVGGDLPAKTVKVEATFQNQTKKMKIVISQINPEIIISSWQEVADF